MNAMTFRTALLAPLVFIALTVPAAAQKMPLDVLSAYLNSIATAQATFTQVNSDETISTGRIFIQRPGRMRFEYDPPDESLVLTSAGIVAIFDAKSNQPPEQFPLARTPLSLILDDTIDFGRPGMVVAHDSVQAATQVTAQDPENPQFGTIALLFTPDPVALRQWVITDDLGQKTTVILGELQTGIEFPASQFLVESELQRRGIAP
jgi:outer membrane lipoprotein-sorting protein